ncbi:MAG: hypothetical protein F4Y75_09930 [Acidimicrobiia bacterium]|nr:hypothetical protein [Acidimicrobiia bacterium]
MVEERVVEGGSVVATVREVLAEVVATDRVSAGEVVPWSDRVPAADEPEIGLEVVGSDTEEDEVGESKVGGVVIGAATDAGSVVVVGAATGTV